MLPQATSAADFRLEVVVLRLRLVLSLGLSLPLAGSRFGLHVLLQIDSFWFPPGPQLELLVLSAWSLYAAFVLGFCLSCLVLVPSGSMTFCDALHKRQVNTGMRRKITDRWLRGQYTVERPNCVPKLSLPVKLPLMCKDHIARQIRVFADPKASEPSR